MSRPIRKVEPFKVIASNSRGESEPYRLTISVYEPIVNFEIADITVGNEPNVVGVDETITFELSVELGNNITFSVRVLNDAPKSTSPSSGKQFRNPLKSFQQALK